jgi:uncharacterized protein YecT (DUF1311 family)
MAAALLGAPLPPSWNVRPADRTSSMLSPVGRATSDSNAEVEGAVNSFQNNQVQDEETDEPPAQKALDRAKKDEQAANEALSARWDKITPAAQTQILLGQRAWINDETAGCDKQADAASGDDVAKATVRAKCDTAATKARTDWLKQYLPGADAK